MTLKKQYSVITPALSPHRVFEEHSFQLLIFLTANRDVFRTCNTVGEGNLNETRECCSGGIKE